MQLEGILFPIMQRMITQDGQDVFEEVRVDDASLECYVLPSVQLLQVCARLYPFRVM